MEFNIERFDKDELVRSMRNMGISCQGKIISPQSKYKGEIFDISWACNWGITLKVLPINRDYTYVLRNVELTQKSIDNFKKRLKDKLDGAVDFFKRQLKADDIIFYQGNLFRILFFVNGKDYMDTVAISPIGESNCEWDYDDFEDEIIDTDRLSYSILIDDPLLLITI